MTQLTDVELVRCVLAGQRECFADLVRRHQDYAYGTAIGMLSDFDLARDVVQEAFFRACRDLHKLKDPARFGGWLAGIVKNTARQAIRELARVRAMADELSKTVEPHDPRPGPAESVQDAEDRTMVQQALARLNDKSREAVSLFYVDGLSYADIADYLDVTEAAVLGRLQRGRAQLRKELAMVARTFKDESLPDDFAKEIQELLDTANRDHLERENCMRRLAEIGAPAVEPLCEALGDERLSVRHAAAWALCRIGDARAMRPLLQVLYARDWATANIAFRNRSLLNVPGIEDELIDLFPKADAGMRWWIFSLLQHATSDRAHDCMLEVLRTGPDARLQVQALGALCRMRPDTAPQRVREFIEQTLDHQTHWRAAVTAWWLALHHGYDLPVELCLKVFGRKWESKVRFFAGEILRRQGEKGCRALEDIVRTGSPDEQATAAMALARDGGQEAFDVLVSELRTGLASRKWRRQVVHTLAGCYGERLVAWTDRQPQDVRRADGIAWALAKVRIAGGSATLSDLYKYGTPTVRVASLRKLARDAGAEFLPELRRVLREGRPRKVAREAFWQMRRMGEAAMPIALEMLESEHWTERKAAVCLLRRWGQLTDEQHDRASQDSHIAVRHGADWHPSYTVCRESHPKWRRRLGEGSKG
ncbi:MAG: sigma-70 family RNA polymerase sigma factor [Planctomycetota bacterium]|jgi:RNA polymerase sigma-70 factor (ECF subfamily)